MAKKTDRSNFFYGYVIVVAAYWIMAVAWGTNRTFGVFLPPLTQEFGWTRAGISGAFTLCMVVLGAISLAAGRLTDHLGSCPLMIACSFFIGGGFLLCSRLDSLWELYLFFGIFTGIGMSGTWVPMMSTVARWFVRRRSLMSGILSAGPPTGIVLMPPLVTWLIACLGWRASFVFIGVLTFLGLSGAAFFLKRDPGQIGATPYGLKKASGTIGGGLGPVLVGYLFDLTGSYQQGFLLCLAVSLVSLTTLFCIASPAPGSDPVSARLQ